MNMKMIAASVEDQTLAVRWQDGRRSCYPHFWLRDHATDPDSWDARSHQRELFTAGLSAEIRPTDIEITDDGDAIKVTWPDARLPASYGAEFLRTFENPAASPTRFGQRAWDRSTIVERRVDLPWSEVSAADGLRALMEALADTGFARLRDCPPEQRTVVDLARRIGYVRETIFGGVWEFEADQAMADSAYTPKELRPHTDSTYCHDAPGLQLLLCCEVKARGGESIMVDGLEIAARLAAEAPESYRILTEVEVPGEYRGDGVHLRAQRPVIRTASDGQVLQVSFNNYDRAPFRLPDQRMAAFYEALRRFDLMANDSSMQWRATLAQGDLLIFDNWRVLHGRGAFQGRRRMTGCYLNREDMESCMRGLGLM